MLLLYTATILAEQTLPIAFCPPGPLNTSLLRGAWVAQDGHGHSYYLTVDSSQYGQLTTINTESKVGDAYWLVEIRPESRNRFNATFQAENGTLFDVSGKLNSSPWRIMLTGKLKLDHRVDVTFLPSDEWNMLLEDLRAMEAALKQYGPSN